MCCFRGVSCFRTSGAARVFFCARQREDEQKLGCVHAPSTHHTPVDNQWRQNKPSSTTPSHSRLSTFELPSGSHEGEHILLHSLAGLLSRLRRRGHVLGRVTRAVDDLGIVVTHRITDIV